MTDEEFNLVVNWISRLVKDSQNLKREIKLVQKRIGEIKQCTQQKKMP